VAVRQRRRPSPDYISLIEIEVSPEAKETSTFLTESGEKSWVKEDD